MLISSNGKTTSGSRDAESLPSGQVVDWVSEFTLPSLFPSWLPDMFLV